MASTIRTVVRRSVYERDLGICQACGFEGNEVHHITPRCYGGSDEDMDNLILLCLWCHRGAPDNKKEFEKYIEKGGAFTALLLGSMIIEIEKADLPINKGLKYVREVCSYFKLFVQKKGIEKYGSKDSLIT